MREREQDAKCVSSPASLAELSVCNYVCCFIVIGMLRAVCVRSSVCLMTLLRKLKIPHPCMMDRQ